MKSRSSIRSFLNLPSFTRFLIFDGRKATSTHISMFSSYLSSLFSTSSGSSSNVPGGLKVAATPSHASPTLSTTAHPGQTDFHYIRTEDDFERIVEKPLGA